MSGYISSSVRPSVQCLTSCSGSGSMLAGPAEARRWASIISPMRAFIAPIWPMFATGVRKAEGLRDLCRVCAGVAGSARFLPLVGLFLLGLPSSGGGRWKSALRADGVLLLFVLSPRAERKLLLVPLIGDPLMPRLEGPGVAPPFIGDLAPPKSFFGLAVE